MIPIAETRLFRFESTKVVDCAPICASSLPRARGRALTLTLFKPGGYGPATKASPPVPRVVLRRLGLASLLALPGCAPSTTLGGGYCAPPSMASFSLRADGPLPDGAPREAQMAVILGLGDVTSDEVAKSSDARLRVVERLALARIAIDATSAELHCEGERAEQAAGYLGRGQTSTVQTLTISSIAAATLTGIIGVLLSTNSRPAAEQDAVAISGGVVTAGLGLSSLFVHPRVTFEHPRNLLADIWAGPAASATYPSFVWTYLTRPEFSNSGQSAIREKIVARWKQFHEVEDPATAAILFGHGGSYDADELRLRAAMLDEVRVEVELAHQELATLAAALLR
jgi:hypothetical protein